MMSEREGTPVEVWAPAFLPVLREWTLDTTQATFRDGTVICSLCEQRIVWSPAPRQKHLDEHLRELEGYAAERRLAIFSPVDGQPGSPRRPKGGVMAGQTKEQTARASAVPDEVVDRIVKEIRAGKGLSTVAKGLNEDSNVATPGKAKEWTPQYVRSLYLRKTGEKGIKAVRTKAPLERKSAAKDTPTKEEPAAEAKTEAEPQESAAKQDAKPDPKPAGRKRGSARQKETVAA
jgi:hypothetical protein